MIRSRILVGVMAVSLVGVAAVAKAQIITPLASGVDALFALQSETFSDFAPPFIPWGLAAGMGPYPAGFIIPPRRHLHPRGLGRSVPDRDRRAGG